MCYRDQLSPWCIVQLLPDAQYTIVQKFRRRSDAEEYLKALRRLNRTLNYTIVFNIDA